MKVAVYSAQEGNETVTDYEFKTVEQLQAFIIENGQVNFEYDEEADAISGMTPCEECDSIPCDCDDEGDDDGEETEE